VIVGSRIDREEKGVGKRGRDGKNQEEASEQKSFFHD
jgi:hypothetical protein